MPDIEETKENPEEKHEQVGGDHYQGEELQHWDLCHMFKWDWFQGNITKYVMRHKKKNGLEDLKKAQHYLNEYIKKEYPEDAS